MTEPVKSLLRNSNKRIYHSPITPRTYAKPQSTSSQVPTPINEAKQPDLTPLLKATETVGKILKAGDLVIYESTVYPGCTEEDCAPVLERLLGLKYLTGSAEE